MSFQVLKDINADLDYCIDWSAWLGADTIDTSTWSVDSSSGITLHGDAVDASRTKTTVWLKDGIANKTGVLVTNKIVTASSPARTDERSLLVTLIQK